MSNSRESRAVWQDKVQSYLDGTLSRREAVRLFLAAERDSELRAVLESYRGLFSQLDDLPKQEPGPGFDDGVLAAVPFEHYRNGPRKPEPVIRLGASQPELLTRLVRRLRSGVVAIAAAYVLFLAVSHSFLQRVASQAAAALGEGLGDLAARTHEVPVISALVGALAGLYDAVISGLSGLSQAWGGALVTILVGLVVGAITAGLVLGARRRHDAKRTHA